MKIFRVVVPIYRFVLFAGCVGFLYLMGLEPEKIDRGVAVVFEWLRNQSDKLFSIKLAILILLLEMGYFIAGFNARRKNRFITFEGDSEKVSLSVQAIEEFIVKVSMGFPEIKGIQAKVFASKNKINVLVRITYLSGHNVASFSENYKRHIRSQLQNILGLDRAIQIQISIDRVDEDKAEVFQDKVFQGLEVH